MRRGRRVWGEGRGCEERDEDVRRGTRVWGEG